MIKSSFYFLIFLTISLVGLNAQENITSPMHEMRAVWVATVDNIDWPSKPGLDTETQKNEAIAIIERVKELNMNTIILQVRPQADAFYKSSIEPWSYYLTGKQGEAPNPYYDPLAFWIEESHKRGIEIHAWFNPYRANHPQMKSELADNSVVKSNPECVAKLGNLGYYWMIPTLQEVQDRSYNVVMDVVKNYDIDGIHFDDYFYPYPDYNEGKDFPDQEHYDKYLKSGGKLSKGDWRREAVNVFVKRIYDGIKAEKQYVKFGISPFGFYRPGYPSTINTGFDQYATLYADAKLWLNKGWVDYYTPQIYWAISHKTFSYPILLAWWLKENTENRNMFPGLYYRPEVPIKDIGIEIVNQIIVTRAMTEKQSGTVLFSMRALSKNNDTINKPLKTIAFQKEALIPTYTWLDNTKPEMPEVNVSKSDSTITISWENTGSEKAFLNVLYFKSADKWDYKIMPQSVSKYEIMASKQVTEVAVSAVDRCGNESEKRKVTVGN